jgi:hypothetical protein
MNPPVCRSLYRRTGFQPVSEGGHPACRIHRPGWKPGFQNSQDGRSPSLILLAAALLISTSPAATLNIQPLDSETLQLSLTADPASYFLLRETSDLRTYFPYAMALGETPNTWNIFPNSETPTRFFQARAISIFAPEDTDGDGIDDLYELRHPVLNPLDPYDAALDPDNNGQTYLQEYRAAYNLGDGKREAISDEVSVFTTRPFTGPALEAISDEVSVFTTRPFTGPALEAFSDEVSVFTTRTFTGPALEAFSDEVSVFTTRPFTGPALEAISDEVSVFTTRTFTGPALEAISDEISLNKTIPSIP